MIFISICYGIICFLIILISSTNEYENFLYEAPEEFKNFCMLPTGNDNDPQGYAYFVLFFLLPLLIPFFLSKKNEKLITLSIILLLLAYWFYSFIFRYIC